MHASNDGWLQAAPVPVVVDCDRSNYDQGLVSQFKPSLLVACPPGCAQSSTVEGGGASNYSSTSQICAAAVHAGLGTDLAGFNVTLLWAPGQASYTGKAASVPRSKSARACVFASRPLGGRRRAPRQHAS